MLDGTGALLTPPDSADVLLNIRPLRSDFVFRFVAGFQYSGFVYFVTVQREFPAVRRAPLVTRLVRLCPGDVQFQSYTELTVGCRPLTSNRKVRVATAAQLGYNVSHYITLALHYIFRLA